MLNLKRRCEHNHMLKGLRPHTDFFAQWEPCAWLACERWQCWLLGNQQDGPSSASSSVSNDLPTAVLLCTPHITGSWATQAPPTLCTWGLVRPKDGYELGPCSDTLSFCILGHLPPNWQMAARQVFLRTHEPRPLPPPHLLWPLRDKGSKPGVQAWIKGVAPWWNFPSSWVTASFVCLGWFWSGLLLVVPPLSCVRCSCSLI